MNSEVKIDSEKIFLSSPKTMSYLELFPDYYYSAPMDFQCLENVKVTSTGIVMKEDCLVLDSIPRYESKRSNFERQAIEAFSTGGGIDLKSKKYLLIHNPWCPGYYHWLVEALPRLIFSVGITKDFVLLFPSFLGRIQADTLRPFGIHKVMTFNYSSSLYVQQLLLPTNVNYTGNYIPSLIHSLRKLFIDFVQNNISEAADLGKYIYISRNNANRRHIANEGVLLSFLTNLCYKKVYLEEYSFFDQVSIFMKASHVVALHGAGLSNIIFMSCNSNVLELQIEPSKNRDGLNLLYYKLSSVCGLNYYLLPCNSCDTSYDLMDSNVHVSLSELESVMLDFHK